MSTIIEASRSDTNRAAWQAAWREENKNNTDQVREAIVLALVNTTYRDNPQTDPTVVAGAVFAFRNDYDRRVKEGQNRNYQVGEALNRNLYHALAAMEAFELGLSAGGEIGVGAAKILEDVYKSLIETPEVQHTVQNWTQEWANEAQWAAYGKFSARIQRVLDVSVQATGLHQDAIDRANINTIIPTLKNLDTQNPVTTLDPILKRLPAAAADKVRAAVKPDGSFCISRDELLSVLTIERAVQDTMLLSTRRTLDDLNRKQADILEWRDAQDQRKRDEEARRVESLAHGPVLDGARATVNIVSTLVGLGDRKLGKQIGTVGESVLQVYKAAETYCDTMAQFAKAAQVGAKASDLAQGMAGVLLTGNVLGAVMNVVSLFRDAGPTPEKIILDQVKALRDQVAKLHKQMNERFDRIEKYLDVLHGGINSIFELCEKRFDQIEYDLASVQRDADYIQDDLARQYLLLGRMEQSVHEGLQTGFRHDFRKAFNSALDYARRNGENMDIAQFNDWESEFYTWAVDESASGNEQPLAGRQYDDDSVLRELELYPLEENVSYLSNWLETRAGLPRLAEGPLANPVTWSLTSWAYTQLQLENPRFAASGTYPARRTDVQEVGEALSSALGRITRHTTEAGVRPNYELFAWLIENYLAKADGLGSALQSIEREQLSREFPDVDPWRGAQQPSTHVPDFSADTPQTLAGFVPAPFLHADYLGLGEPGLNARLQPEWIGPTRFEKRRGQDVSFVNRYAHLRVAVIVEFETVPVLSRAVVSDELVAEVRVIDNRTGEEIRGRHEDIAAADALEHNWLGGQRLKARFEEHSDDLAAPVGVDAVATRVETRLRELRASVYGRIGFELVDGQSLDEPRRRLDGAKALIDRWVSLGMPTALTSDDFLRALLFGEQALLDTTLLRAAYKDAYVDALPTGADAGRRANVRVTLLDQAKARGRSLGDHLRGYLDVIGAGELREDPAIVSTALLRTAAASTVVRILDAAFRTTPPTGSLAINRGAHHTRTPDVTLALASTGGDDAPAATDMRFSHDGRTWTPWERFASRKSWRLRGADGRKRVCAQLRSGMGIVSAVIDDAIVLDTAPPVITPQTPAPRSTTRRRKPTISAIVSDGSNHPAKRGIRLQLDGAPITSFSYDPVSGRIAYTPSSALEQGRHTARVAARDLAGNVKRKQWSFEVTG